VTIKQTYVVTKLLGERRDKLKS